MNNILYFIERLTVIFFLLLMIYIVKSPENDASDEWDNW